MEIHESKSATAAFPTLRRWDTLPGDKFRIVGLRVSNVGAAGISEAGRNQVMACFANGCGHEGIYSGGWSILKGNTVNGNATRGINAALIVP